MTGESASYPIPALPGGSSRSLRMTVGRWWLPTRRSAILLQAHHGPNGFAQGQHDNDIPPLFEVSEAGKNLRTKHGSGRAMPLQFRYPSRPSIEAIGAYSKDGSAKSGLQRA